MYTDLAGENELVFNVRIFDCIERAMSLIGNAEKELILHQLAVQYQLSGFDIAKNPYALEQCLKESLGAFEAASVLVQTVDNISSSFKVDLKDDCTLGEAIAEARNKVIFRISQRFENSEQVTS